MLTDKPLHRQKRQENPSASVVHVTVTEASSVDYTYTETHFSYVPSSAPVITPDKIGNKGANASDLDLGVIIGGAVGGTALLVIICKKFLYKRQDRYSSILFRFNVFSVAKTAEQKGGAITNKQSDYT